MGDINKYIKEKAFQGVISLIAEFLSDWGLKETRIKNDNYPALIKTEKGNFEISYAGEDIIIRIPGEIFEGVIGWELEALCREKGWECIKK